MPTIGISQFVRRQTPDSKFSHFEGSWELLRGCVEFNFANAKPGYRDGVVLVPLNPNDTCAPWSTEHFFSGIVKVEEGTELTARLVRRRPDEEQFIENLARSRTKLPGKTVDIVCYRKDVLLEEKDAVVTGADWDVISVNVSPEEGPMPMDPITMMRNFLVLKGGTKATYTAEEFARSIHYWSTRAMIDPS